MKKKDKKVKKKRKIHFKGVIFLLLISYIIIMIFYMLFTMPIKNIEIDSKDSESIQISGLQLLTDNEIIEVAGIKDYPSIFKISTKKIENKIKTLELVKDVKVKKQLNGKLIIEIEEDIPLFYYRKTGKIVLSSGKEVEQNEKYVGIPSMINSCPKEILQKFVEAFSKIDLDIIKMINEIEYDPSISEGITIDEYRFLLRMNDQNHVYVNTINLKRLNDYKQAYDYLTSKGTLYLDSYTSEEVINYLFIPFENMKKDDQDEPRKD